MKWLHCVIFFILTIHLVVSGQNISIDTSTYSIEELVQDVLIQSECAEISNVTLTGHTAQIGYFSNGLQAIQVQKGIILSTGKVMEAQGPNQRTGTGNWLDFFDGAHVGDEDLRRVANVNVNQVKDDAILEFDFIPLDDHIEFDFVFASEEYCDYAGANVQFNDVFGFFLSGPGLSGPYSNDAVNIGVTPDGSSNITVKNINHNVNFDYFIDNTPKNQPLALPEHYENCRLDVPRDGIASLMEQDGSSIANLEYDGYTVTMKAQSDVVPFQQYHLKIAIADIIDGGWDSAVFLKAGSFRAGQPQAIIETPDSIDCQNPTIVLDGTNSSRGKKYAYQWSTEDGNIVSGAQVYSPTVDDAGTYRLVVSRVGTNCADTAYVDVFFNDDRPEILDVHSLAIQCDRPSVEIEIDIATPDQYAYQLKYPGGNFSMETTVPSISTTHAGWHTIYVYAANGCEDSEMYFVEIDTFSGSVIFEGYEYTCRDDALQITPNFEDQSNSFEFLWSTIDGSILSPIDNLNVTVGSAGLYQLTAQNIDNGCTHDFYVDIASNETPPDIFAGADQQLDCRSMEIIPNALILNPTGNEVITWNTITGGAIIPGADALHPIITSSGTYNLIVEGQNGCVTSDTIEIMPAPDAPIIQLIRVDKLTCEQLTTNIDLSIEGNYESILWSTDNGKIDIVSANNLSAQVSQSGLYTIEATNAEGCMTKLVVEVEATQPPPADAGRDVELDCDGLAILSANENIVLPGLVYEWTMEADPTFTTENITTTTSRAGTYFLKVSDPISGCTSFDTVSILPGDELIDYTLEFTECQFDSGLFFIEDDHKAMVESFTYGAVDFSPEEVLAVGEHNSVQINLKNGCTQVVQLEYILNEELTIELVAPVQIIAGEPFDLFVQVNRLEREILSVLWKNVEVDCQECLNQSFTLEKPTTIEISIQDIYGCIREAQIHIVPKILYEVYIPSAFSPNDDGVNDRLEIFYNEHVSGIESMKIFNRWGGEVFSLTNDNIQSLGDDNFMWDGTVNHGDSAPSGLYIYTTTIRSSNGRSFEYSGSFVLLR